jgi:L-gulonate 3-dehydrogenase
MEKIAIVGAGLIGCAWAAVFARAGHPVAMYDINSAALASAKDTIAASLAELYQGGLMTEPANAVLGRVDTVASLAEAVKGAALVQENVRETEAAKKEIFAELDRLADPSTVLASSTSGIPASTFTADLPGRARCLVGHPINPPSLIPLVELVPAPWTEASTVDKAQKLYCGAGQVPIRVHREIQGFIVNRLQGALLSEAFRLVEDGYISSADVDKAVKDGLGLRWAFMGPFETIDLNAPGGIRDYCERYGPLYLDIARQAQPRAWEQPLLDRLERQRQQELPVSERAGRLRWRDQRLMKLVAHKRQLAEQEKPA